MADGSNNGVTTGASAVTVVAAPAASTTRMIPRYGISLLNVDTATVKGYLQLNDNGTVRKIERIDRDATTSYFNTSYISLTDATMSLEIVLDAAAATTEPDFVVKFRDEAQ